MGDEEGSGQPTPRPSRPLQDEVVVDGGLELDDVVVEADVVDDDEVDGRGQPIPNPKGPLH